MKFFARDARPRTAVSLWQVALLCGALSVASVSASAESTGPMFEVTVTNVTAGQLFTPLLVVSHTPGVKIYTPGAPASDELVTLAESGNIGPLESALLATPGVADVAKGAGLLHPGQSVTFSVATMDGATHVSVAAMLLPTNDGFVGLGDVAGPSGQGTVTVHALAYDAGSETNDESCAHIPGGAGCGGEALSPGDLGEGFVHVHRGIHGIGDLDAAAHDWRNPVALVRITRITPK